MKNLKKKCIVSFEDGRVLSKLRDLGFECYPVIKSSLVSPEICRHSDVLYNKVTEHKIIVSACQSQNFLLLEEQGYEIVLYNGLKPGYKTECGLNFIIDGSIVVRNPKTAIEFHTNLPEIRVKQGYTRCNVLHFGNSFITGDKGIFTALQKAGQDCLLIDDSNILLPGYDHGFIGGRSAVLNNSEVLFFGQPDDIDVISSFLSRRGVIYHYIEGKQMTDIGSRLIL